MYFQAFQVTKVQKSVEICTVEGSSNYVVGNNWAKKSYSDAKAYCESEGKELAYFEDFFTHFVMAADFTGERNPSSSNKFL